MSAFDNLYNDFPLRVAELWIDLHPRAKLKRREVTFMLMAAAAGFATPWDHLRLAPGEASTIAGHPAYSCEDTARFAASLEKIAAAVKVKMSGSCLFSGIDLGCWFFGKTETNDMGEVMDVVEKRSKNGSAVGDLEADFILRLMRNAIAHSNIHGFGSRDCHEIEELVLFSEKLKWSAAEKKVEHFRVLTLPVGDLAKFLKNWFSLLHELSKDDDSQVRRAVATIFDDDTDLLAA